MYIIILTVFLGTGHPESATVSPAMRIESCQQILPAVTKNHEAPPGYEVRVSCANRPQVDALLSAYNCRIVDTAAVTKEHAYVCFDDRRFQ